MLIARRVNAVNPRLGTYFSIFASLFAAMFLMALIVGQMGTGQMAVSDFAMRMLLLGGPIFFYILIGIVVTAREPLDYFAAGRRVPAGYTGLTMAMASIGATGLVAGTGLFFLAGFDALFLLIGGLSGFVVTAVLLAPFYRKYGAFTVPSYLGKRFDSKQLRLIAASLAAVPILLIIAAEFSMGARAAMSLAGVSFSSAVLLLAAVVTLTTTLGGFRSQTWSGVAQSVAALLAIIAPIAVVAVIVTSLPLPQLTHGPLVRNLVRNEPANLPAAVAVSPLAFELPGQSPIAITKPYTMPFGQMGALAFAIGAIVVACGVSSAPWLLTRVSATPSVYDTRKSLGWATVFYGVVLLTLSSAAVFMRDQLLDLVMSERVGPVPGWLAEVTRQGFAEIHIGTGAYTYASFPFYRDGVLFSLPIANGLPQAFVDLTFAGIIAAALHTAGAAVIALANILAEDVVGSMSAEAQAGDARVTMARIAVPLVAIAGLAITLAAPTDPFELFFWSLQLSAATLFPALILSIWWKRMTAASAIIGMLVGFGAACLCIMASEIGVITISSAISGALGIPAGVLAILIVSTVSPVRTREGLEAVADIRVPGGEIIYDRETRLARLRSRAAPIG